MVYISAFTFTPHFGFGVRGRPRVSNAEGAEGKITRGAKK